MTNKYTQKYGKSRQHKATNEGKHQRVCTVLLNFYKYQYRQNESIFTSWVTGYPRGLWGKGWEMYARKEEGPFSLLAIFVYFLIWVLVRWVPSVYENVVKCTSMISAFSLCILSLNKNLKEKE